MLFKINQTPCFLHFEVTTFKQLSVSWQTRSLVEELCLKIGFHFLMDHCGDMRISS